MFWGDIMEHVLNNERQQAIKFIKEDLNKKIKAIDKENKKLFDVCRKDAKNFIDRKYSYSNLIKKINEYRQKATDLEHELEYSLLPEGKTKCYGSISSQFEKLVTTKSEEMINETTPGQQRQSLVSRLHEVERQVFMATTHEEIVSLIDSLT